MKTPPVHAPVLAADRIHSLDVLRGFALLGVLIMNMQCYSMIEAAFMNPTAYGDFNGVHRLVWVLEYLFGDLKFMANFSMLFGAGILLMSQRAEDKGRGSAGLHYRRMLWLLVIGLIHAYGLWYGDILVSYAICGMVVYLMRNLRPAWLLTLGCLFLIPPSLLFLLGQLTMPWWPPESMTELLADWEPDQTMVQAELDAYRGSWWAQMGLRGPSSFIIHVFLVPMWMVWRAGGMMLIGMALLKKRVLTAERSTGFYVILAGLGLGLGLPVVLGGIAFNFANDWSVDRSMFLGYQFNYWGSLPVALGYMSLVMLAVKHGILVRLQHGLAAMGRMAFTNYLSQSLICTTLFYGHGFGLFGRVERLGQFLIALTILGIQMVFSVLWLRHFRYGPLEWVWRSLTYKRVQPMRVQPGPAR